jgi:hypothetical protein
VVTVVMGEMVDQLLLEMGGSAVGGNGGNANGRNG